MTRKKKYLKIKTTFFITDGKINLRLIGVEPTTFGTEIQRSIQLSYKRTLTDNKINDTNANYT
jgi:hypothetical protein